MAEPRWERLIVRLASGWQVTVRALLRPGEGGAKLEALDVVEAWTVVAPIVDCDEVARVELTAKMRDGLRKALLTSPNRRACLDAAIANATAGWRQ